MRKIITLMLAGILVMMMVLTGCDGDSNGEKSTIKLTELNWDSAYFQSAVAKIIIEEGYGHNVELVPGATIPLTQGLRTGDVDIMIEGWYQNQKEAVDAGIDAGEIEMLAYINNDNWQSAFVVPTYVIEGDTARGIEPMAPNLKSVFDLVEPEYVELFANPENSNKGLILNGPPGWECEIVVPLQVEAYGLADDYDTINAGSSEGLFASLKSAYDKGDPWIGYLWGPTWIAGALDLTLLEEPAYDEAVWNENYGCAWPSVDLFIAAHGGFTEKYPEVAAMFKNWRLNTATLDVILAYMSDNGAEPDEAAVWFLKEYENLWTSWVSGDAATKIKAALADM